MRAPGFSLLETLFVIVILGLLLGGLLVPLSKQIDGRNRRAAEAELREIREMLLGFGMIGPARLPCASTSWDTSSATYGLEDAGACATPTAEGALPWRSLGAPDADPWGRAYRYRVDRNFAAAQFGMTTGFGADSIDVLTPAALQDSPVAVVFSVGANGIPDLENATFESTAAIYQAAKASTEVADFDDVLVVLSREELLARLVRAGLLP